MEVSFLVCTKFYSTDELNVLFVFVDYSQTLGAVDLLKENRVFSKIVPTPKNVFSAASLAIVIRDVDLEKTNILFEENNITPIKTIVSPECVLSYNFEY